MRAIPLTAGEICACIIAAALFIGAVSCFGGVLLSERAPPAPAGDDDIDETDQAGA